MTPYQLVLLAFAVASALPHVQSSSFTYPGCRAANCTQLDGSLKIAVNGSGYGDFFVEGQASIKLIGATKVVADLGCYLVSTIPSPVISVLSTPVSFAHAIPKDVFGRLEQMDMTEVLMLMYSIIHESRGYFLRIRR